MVLLFFKYYLLLISVVLTIGVSGWTIASTLLRTWRIEGFYFSLFLGCTLSTILTVVLFSVIYASGVTVNLIILMPLFILWYLNKNSANKATMKIAFQKEVLVVIPILCFIILLFQSYGFLINSVVGYNFTNHDLVYYAKISTTILHHHIETNSLFSLIFDNEYKIPTMYHYFEIWLVVLIMKIISLPAIGIMWLVVYPLFIILVFLGILSIAEYYRKVTYQEFFLAFLLLFFSGISFHFYEHFKITSLAKPLIFSFLSGCGTLKYGMIYSLLILIVNLLLRGKAYEGICFLFMLPSISIITIFGLFGACLSFLIVRMNMWKIILCCGLFSFLIVLCLYNTQSAGELSLTKFCNFYDLQKAQGFNTYFNIFFGTIIGLFILFLPHFLLLIKSKVPLVSELKNHMNLILFVFLGVLSSLLGWVLFYFLIDAVQLFTGYSFLIINATFIWIWYFVFYQVKSRSNKLICFSFVFLIGLSNIIGILNSRSPKIGFSEGYLSATNRIIPKLKNPVGVSILENRNCESNDFECVSNFSILGDYLACASGQYYTIYINPHDFKYPLTEPVKTRKEYELQSNIFYRYSENRKRKGVIESIEQSQIHFIKEFNIDYLIVDGGAPISQALEQCFKFKIHDKISGESFYYNIN